MSMMKCEVDFVEFGRPNSTKSTFHFIVDMTLAILYHFQIILQCCLVKMRFLSSFGMTDICKEQEEKSGEIPPHSRNRRRRFSPLPFSL